MAQIPAQSPAAPVQKRGPGRPRKDGATPNKRLKLSDINDDVLSGNSSKQGTPLSERRSRALPTRLVDSRPLPVLQEPQSLSLPDAEYATIAASGVLARSLEQSRISWTQIGVFERYWVKPETGKNARPPPPNNPDYKSMKTKGKCRLRIEPHIFEVDIFVVERPKPAPTSKQYLPPKSQTMYGQVWNNQQYQGQAYTQRASPAPAPPAAPSPQQQDKKVLADPVIGLLAAKAGSDPELKALMREVAAGHAPPEQLQVFQKHIDELNALLREQKVKEEAQQRAYAAQQTAYTPPPKYVPPPPAPPGEVVFSFTIPGSTADRFLFPQHCILETLTPQHLLASFVIVKKGSEVPNATDLEPSKEYWSPITLMVEVAYGRESILEDIKRWVKSTSESQEYMSKIIAEVERAPETHLALRLPLKGTAAAAESISTSKTGTPVPQVIEEKKRKKEPALTKKRSSLAGSKAAVASADQGESIAVTTPPVSNEPTAVKAACQEPEAGAVSASGRPTRATRKSSRFSDAV